jgi:O-antigen/teichoic acid export membrane protein
VMKFVASDLGAGEPTRAAAKLGMCTLTIAGLVAAVCGVLWPLLDAGLAIVITEPRLLAAARQLLPWALAALWVGSMAQVLLTALDALQRSELKALVTLGAGVGQLAAAYALVPTHGLQSLGPMQVLQAALSAVAAGACVFAVLGVGARGWFGWSRRRLIDMLRYGAGVQIAAVGQLLFEPSVKALLTGFGSLTLTGYYELANRAVSQCRAVIVAAYQMLIPYLAHRAGSQALSPAQVVSAYRTVHAVLFVLSVPYFALLAAALPLLLSLWLGHFELAFVAIGLACVVGWGLNTLVVAAYMIYLGIGRVAWPLRTQLTIGILNLALASGGGWLWGGFGVIGGAMLALALGSAVVAVAFHLEFKLSWRDFVPVTSAPIIGTSLAGAVAIAGLQIVSSGSLQSVWPIAAVLAIFGLACLGLTWRHPAVRGLVGRLRNREAAA